MNVVYAGYRKWAFDIVKALLKEKSRKYKIVGVLTIDKPEASYASLPVSVYPINPGDLNNRENRTIVKKLKPDVFLFYGWSWMIPKEIYEHYPCLILHTSPLPKYRGGSPLQNQIISGETRSSISIFQATKGLDEGPIYAQAPFSLEGTLERIVQNIVKAGLKET